MNWWNLILSSIWFDMKIWLIFLLSLYTGKHSTHQQVRTSSMHYINYILDWNQWVLVMSPSFALLKHELLCLHKRRRANTKLCALYQSQCLAQKLEADNFVAGHWILTASCIVWERRYYFIYDWWDLHIGNRSMYNSQHRKWVKIIDWNVISSILRYDRIVLYLILRCIIQKTFIL